MSRIDADEIAHWEELAHIDPWGTYRDDWHAALIANTVARCAGNKTAPKDFLLRFEPPRAQSDAEMLNIFKALQKQQCP